MLARRSAWPDRANKLGKQYGEAWRRSRSPFYAEDFDADYFQAAPPDQRLDAPLRGDEEPGAVRAAAHGDINLLTILPAATEPGLQVLGKDHLWYDVPCDFGLLIVNIGDMLAEASGNYYPSTVHRVLNPTGEGRFKSRISMPLFLHPRREVVLSERYTVGSYFEERMRELARNN